MKMNSIRNRMLLAALLPVTLVALLLAGVFLFIGVGDIEEEHGHRNRSLVRQLAAASEYGLFSGNVTHLQAIASGALREPDVRSVQILDLEGHALASVGQPRYKSGASLSAEPSESFDAATDMDFLAQPIVASPLKLDDLFESKAGAAAPAPQLLGHVLVEFSNETPHRRERKMLLLGLAATLGGLLFGCLLALGLGRGVIRPILRISDMVERIGDGELSARAPVLPNDPLGELQRVLNQMAQALESGRDELEQRIAMATLELREKKEEAETAVLAKSRFLAAASHDLRQPTHALGMFVARLAQLPHDEQTRQLIASLEASLHALQDLLDGLLDISRLDAQSVQVQLQPFALADIFEQLRAGLSLTAREKGLRLRVRPTTVCVMSDPTLLHRILLNLLGNALRYTEVGGVLLACRVAGGGTLARIEVWDSGIGIAPEHHQAIFKEFYQVGNTERDRNKGLGLGLNIVERTARLLGHRLHLRSSPGRGTRFRIDVPLLASGVALERPGLAPASSPDPLVGLIVLVIEDDALAREGLVTLLESWGSVVRVAEGLSSALWHMKFGLVPDVIVSDYRLRDGENGMEVIRQLRYLAARPIAACLMSGDTDPSLMQEAKRAGLVLLHKPVRPAKLRSLVRRWANDAQAEGPDLT